MNRRSPHSKRRLRRKFLQRQVHRRLGRDRVHFTLNLAAVAKLPESSERYQEYRQAFLRFNRVLGKNWTTWFRKAPPADAGKDCQAQRPCRYFGCPHHLAIERADHNSLSLRLLQPQTKLKALPFTCVFDVVRANPDGASMSLIGALLALQKQGIHYHWRIAQRKLKAMGRSLDKRRPGMQNTQTQTETPTGPEQKVYPPHPAARIFPRMEGPEFKALVDDVKAHGLRERIVLLDNQVLDGRNRYAACVSAGVEPQFVQWVPKPGETPTEYVVSMNLRRRHLDESQRAMLAATLEPMYAAEARERQKATQFSTETVVVAKTPPPDPGKAREKTAALLNVSARSVQSAKAVLTTGAPEVIEQVVSGDLAVSVAADLAKLPPEKQVEVVRQNKGAIKRAVQQVRREESDKRRTKRALALTKESAAAKQEKPQALGRYPILLVDYPWEYDHPVSDSREVPYPTMPLDEIKALPIENLATKDAVLFCWTTPGKIADAVHVIEARGFRVVSSEVWEKPSVGPGYYFRLRHEVVLLATRGKPITPAEKDRPDSIFKAARGRHSEKPEEHYRRIERMYRGLPKIELFARKRRDGWVSVGSAIDGSDIRDVLRAAGTKARA